MVESPARHIQPAMMILWTNDPVIKRELLRQRRSSLWRTGTSNVVDLLLAERRADLNRGQRERSSWDP
jgi:hypothetical protein